MRLRFVIAGVFIFFASNALAVYSCWYNSVSDHQVIFDLNKLTTSSSKITTSTILQNTTYSPGKEPGGCGHTGWNVWHDFSMTNDAVILRDDLSGEEYGYFKIKVNSDGYDKYLTQTNTTGAQSVYTGSYTSLRPWCFYYGTNQLHVTVELTIHHIPKNPITLPVGHIYAVGVNAQSESEARAAGVNCAAYKNTYSLLTTGSPTWSCKINTNQIDVDFGEINPAQPRSETRTIEVDCLELGFNNVKFELKPGDGSAATDKGLSSNIDGAYVLIGGDMSYDNTSKTWKASFLPNAPGNNVAYLTMVFTPDLAEIKNEQGVMTASAVLVVNIN